MGGLVILFALGAGSCSNPTPPQDGDAQKAGTLTPVPPPPSPVPVPSPVPPMPASAAPVEQPAPAAPAEPVQAPSKPVHDANVAPNGSFEEKDDNGRPRGWAISPATSIAKDGEDAQHGKGFLSLTGEKDSWTVIFCELAGADRYPDTPLRMEAWGKAPAAESMKIALICTEDGEEKEVSAKYWPVSEDWGKIEFLATIPEASDKGSAKLRILIKQGAGSGFALDNIRVIPDFLSGNGSLEDKDDTGRPRGWVVSPNDIIVKTGAPAYDGAQALALKGQAEFNGIIAHDILISSAYRAKTLVVSAWARSNSTPGLTMYVESGETGKVKALSSHQWAPSAEWQQGVIRVELGENIDTESLKVRFVLPRLADEEYAIDMVQASIE